MDPTRYRHRIAAGLLALTGLATADCPDKGLTGIETLKTGHINDGETVRVRGVVTGDFRGDDALDGFYIQAPGDGSAHRGIFVYAPSLEPDSAPIEPGRSILVVGRADRYRGQRQVSRVSQILACGDASLPEPVALTLPEVNRSDWRPLEGMLVRVPGPLTVTGNRELARYGSLDLSVNGRLMRSDVSPDAHPARRIILDDGSYSSHPAPIPYRNEAGTRRTGSRLPAIEGVLTHAFGAWRLHPVSTDAVVFQEANPRPDPPVTPEGIRVAVFNVENYFRTLGERGANSVTELQAQRQALTAVFVGLDADLVALQEIENRPQAAEDILRMLSRATGRDYRHLATEHPVGNDVIRSMIAWRPSRIRLLDGPFIDHDAAHSRPPVAGLFRLGDGEQATLIATFHHKSKGGCPETGDTDEGQGCWNERRVAQSQALRDFVRARAESLGTEHVLLIGDVNAYADEEPLTLLTDGGWSDLVRTRLPRNERYSYVYRGVAGVLDTAIASPGVANRVQSLRFWRLNADEPPFTADQPGPWRSSDHDPLIINLRE